MSLSPIAVEVFCSYAHQDELYYRQLKTHLSVLKRQGLISLWHNRQILPGANWAKAIEAYLERASIILLLISADFIASDYCYSVEMKQALKRHEADEARVLPIIVRPCDWQQSPLASFQTLPPDAKPISMWASADEAWMQVTAGLRRVIEDLSLLSASTSPKEAHTSTFVEPMSPIEFYSCFISCSSHDQEIAKRLRADLQSKGVRCWFAPEDMKIGDKIRSRIENSIRAYDKLLLILSSIGY